MGGWISGLDGMVVGWLVVLLACLVFEWALQGQAEWKKPEFGYTSTMRQCTTSHREIKNLFFFFFSLTWSYPYYSISI
jgi:hypothetical protein